MKFFEASHASFWSQHTAPTSLSSESNEGNTWTTLVRRLISHLILSCTLLVGNQRIFDAVDFSIYFKRGRSGRERIPFLAMRGANVEVQS